MRTATGLLFLILATFPTNADIKAFELIIDDPNIEFQSIEYYTALVNGYIRLGYLDNAERDLNEGLSKYPEAIGLLLLRGSIFFQKGDVDAEYNYYTYLLSKYPTESKIYFARSYCDYDLQKWELYLSDLKKTVELDSTNAEALGNIGLFYLERKDFGPAREYLMQAYAADPLLVSTVNNIASVYYQSHEYLKAIEWATKAIKLNPSNAIAYRIRGLSNNAAGNTANGEKDLQKAEEIAAEKNQNQAR